MIRSIFGDPDKRKDLPELSEHRSTLRITRPERRHYMRKIRLLPKKLRIKRFSIFNLHIRKDGTIDREDMKRMLDGMLIDNLVVDAGVLDMTVTT